MEDDNLLDMLIILALFSTTVGALGMSTWLVTKVECNCDNCGVNLSQSEKQQWEQVVSNFYN